MNPFLSLLAIRLTMSITHSYLSPLGQALFFFLYLQQNLLWFFFEYPIIFIYLSLYLFIVFIYFSFLIIHRCIYL